MKYKLIALTLALTVLSWAQAVTPSATNSQPTQISVDTAKSDCGGCCKHMAGDKDAKDGKGCCHDMKADAKSCCAGKDGKGCMGKDGKSCMKGESADASCAKGKCCDMKDAKGCCSHGDADKTAMACCSGMQCGMGHSHADMKN